MYHELALYGARDVSTATPHNGETPQWVDSPKDSPVPASDAPVPDFASSILEARDVERIRLGQELHDSTGQLLVALKLSIAHYRATSPTAPAGFLQEIGSAVSEIEQQIRAFSFLHYPAQLAEQGLAATLQGFARSFARKTGIHVFVRCGDCSPHSTDPAALDLLRVAQEALTNVYRHARATSVRIALSHRNGQLELRIKDDGCGLPGNSSLPWGVGLQSMRHRVERNGGQLTLRRRQKGFEVLASMPIAEFETLA